MGRLPEPYRGEAFCITVDCRRGVAFLNRAVIWVVLLAAHRVLKARYRENDRPIGFVGGSYQNEAFGITVESRKGASLAKLRCNFDGRVLGKSPYRRVTAKTTLRWGWVPPPNAIGAKRSELQPDVSKEFHLLNWDVIHMALFSEHRVR